MPRKITDPYEVLGLHRGATDAAVRAAYLRLAKKHHPDKNPGDKASEWIFKEVQRAYETLRDANEVRAVGQERPPRAEESPARPRHEQRPPPPSDRGERAKPGRQRDDGRTRRRLQEEMRRLFSISWRQATHAAREDARPASICRCGSTVHLIGALGKLLFIYGCLVIPGIVAPWLLSQLGVPLSPSIEGIVLLGTVGLALVLSVWATAKPCPHCGRVWWWT